MKGGRIFIFQCNPEFYVSDSVLWLENIFLSLLTSCYRLTRVAKPAIRILQDSSLIPSAAPKLSSFATLCYVRMCLPGTVVTSSALKDWNKGTAQGNKDGKIGLNLKSKQKSYKIQVS